MKRLLILLIFFAAISLGGCKKDYPKDIPQWLKNCILEFKRTQHCKKVNMSSCIQGAPIWIDECRESTTGTVLFRFGSIDPTTYRYYNLTGDYVGSTDSWTNQQQIGPYQLANIGFFRKIWTAKGCE